MTETDKNLGDEKPAVEEEVADGNKDNPVNEAEEKEPEDKVNVHIYLKSFRFNLYLLRLYLNFYFFLVQYTNKRYMSCHWFNM